MALAHTIGFFGHDSTESTVIKRATAFQAHGWEVIGFMFRRVRPTQPRPVTWENVELGTTIDLHYTRRMVQLLAALLKVGANRGRLRRCSVLYARNIDMLLLAVLAKYVTHSDVTVVYEVLDVPRAVLGTGLLNKALRFTERWLIARTDLLVVSSPEFMTQYFFKYQGYSGPWHLLENKVTSPRLLAQEIVRPSAPPPGTPWVIGWFGTLRCARSVKLLSDIAERLGDRIRIDIRGLASEEYLPSRAIRAAADRQSNMIYWGPYASPRDLPQIYGKVHFTWCIDYLDAGTNSDWLLPNRLYEGGLMGAIALARKHTATGSFIERENLGFTFEEPLRESVISLLDTLSAETYADARQAITTKKLAVFVDETDTRDLLENIELLSCSRQKANAHRKSAG